MAVFVKKLVNIEDKVFLVTGGAAGVGAGVVRALLSDNARHVAFLDIMYREGAALEQDLSVKFGALRAKFIRCDVSDEDALLSAFQQVLDKYRRLDVVINNAAILSPEGSYKRMVDVNFTATVNSTLKAIEVMGVNHGGLGGTVINISSLLALRIGTHLPVYAATKTAVLQFSICMGTKENFNKTKVRVLAVCLGPTDTALVHRSNSINFDKAVQTTDYGSSADIQRVESAVNGIIEVINEGESGSTWIVEDDRPAYDITDKMVESFRMVSRSDCGCRS